MYANFCFGTPVLFTRACACVALSGWRVKNYRHDNTRKSLGPVIYRKRVPRAGKQLAGSPGYRLTQRVGGRAARDGAAISETIKTGANGLTVDQRVKF